MTTDHSENPSPPGDDEKPEPVNSPDLSGTQRGAPSADDTALDRSVDAAVEAILFPRAFEATLPPPVSPIQQAAGTAASGTDGAALSDETPSRQRQPTGPRRRRKQAKPRRQRKPDRPRSAVFLSRGFSRALGIVGEVLITLGVVVMLFLGWQVWINDLIVSHESGAVAAMNAEKWSSSHSPSNAPTAQPTSTAPIDYGPAPAMSPAAENEVFGNFYIPRLGNDYIKVAAEGVSTSGTLDRGYFGHYPDSQQPGEWGNTAFATHRAQHGSSFRAAPQLRTGDLIVLQTAQGYYEYRVRNTEYVNPTQVEVVSAVPGKSSTPVEGQSLLTITTCNPEGGDAERLITYAVLVGWRPVDAGPPQEIASMRNG